MSLISLSRETRLDPEGKPDTTLRVSAVSSDPMVLPSEIFVHCAVADSPYKRYSNVATFPQITEMGTKATADVPFFRQSSAILACRTPEDAENDWLYIVKRVRRLVSQATGDATSSETIEL